MSLIVFPLGESPLGLSGVLLFVDKFAKDLNGPLITDDAAAVELVLSFLEPDH